METKEHLRPKVFNGVEGSNLAQVCSVGTLAFSAGRDIMPEGPLELERVRPIGRGLLRGRGSIIGHSCTAKVADVCGLKIIAQAVEYNGGRKVDDPDVVESERTGM